MSSKLSQYNLYEKIAGIVDEKYTTQQSADRELHRKEPRKHGGRGDTRGSGEAQLRRKLGRGDAPNAGPKPSGRTQWKQNPHNPTDTHDMHQKPAGAPRQAPKKPGEKTSRETPEKTQKDLKKKLLAKQRERLSKERQRLDAEYDPEIAEAIMNRVMEKLSLECKKGK